MQFMMKNGARQTTHPPFASHLKAIKTSSDYICTKTMIAEGGEQNATANTIPASGFPPVRVPNDQYMLLPISTKPFWMTLIVFQKQFSPSFSSCAAKLAATTDFRHFFYDVKWSLNPFPVPAFARKRPEITSLDIIFDWLSSNTVFSILLSW